MNKSKKACKNVLKQWSRKGGFLKCLDNNRIVRKSVVKIGAFDCITVFPDVRFQLKLILHLIKSKRKFVLSLHVILVGRLVKILNNVALQRNRKWDT